MLMADDGISGLVWARRVHRFLAEGLNVLAVTTADNEYRCIGIGGLLPTYENQGFLSNPEFTQLTIKSLAEPSLLNALAAAGSNTVVCWNMDPFEFSGRQNVDHHTWEVLDSEGGHKPIIQGSAIEAELAKRHPL